MATQSVYLITFGILIVTAASLGYYYSDTIIESDIFQKKDLLLEGTANPTLWLYYDQSDVNSRWWQDFGARSSRVLHTPFLNLCYQSIAKHCGQTYNIRVIAGLTDLATLLGGWDQLPKSLQNPLASVQQAEMNYIRSKILKTYGGLWVNPSCIFVKDMPDFNDSKDSKEVIFTGMDTKDMLSDSEGTLAPGTQVMYSSRKEHPIFVELERLSRERLERREGGMQFRHDISNDLRDVMRDYSGEYTYIPSLEFSRKPNGHRIELEDLLSKGKMPVCSKAVYVPVYWHELKRRSNFAWFLRLSEEQIMSSELVVSNLF
uniref:Uncharacterized protein n=1 Tax=viral metagenome TaxID=1070528 RepID=A0A6C0IHN8_9ZZZZ